MNTRLIVALALLATPCCSFAQEGTAPVTTVTPGLVRWHSSLEEAIAAAKESKKPVLHFQLLGRLDQELC